MPKTPENEAGPALPVGAEEVRRADELRQLDELSRRLFLEERIADELGGRAGLEEDELENLRDRLLSRHGAFTAATWAQIQAIAGEEHTGTDSPERERILAELAKSRHGVAGVRMGLIPEPSIIRRLTTILMWPDVLRAWLAERGPAIGARRTVAKLAPGSPALVRVLLAERVREYWPAALDAVGNWREPEAPARLAAIVAEMPGADAKACASEMKTQPFKNALAPAHRLAGALWSIGAVRTQAARMEAIKTPALHPVVANVLLLRSADADFHREEDGGHSVVHPLGELGRLPPAALVRMSEGALEADALKALAPLAAWLATEADARWRRGEARPDFVPIPTGRDALRARLGDEVTDDDIGEALEWLRNFRVGDYACVNGWTEDRTHQTGKAGRPEKRRVVQVGAPLAPMGLEAVFREAKVGLPPELRFYAPVLNPAGAPQAGNRRTASRQRAFYAIGLGLLLTERREEYAERGGIQIEPDEWRRRLQAMGIYHRTHHSLADDVLEALTKAPEPNLFPSRHGPVLVEVSPNSRRFKLGPGFADQERAIISGAEESQSARRRRALAKSRAKGRRPKKDP
jgi:hypothetical protein